MRKWNRWERKGEDDAIRGDNMENWGKKGQIEKSIYLQKKVPKALTTKRKKRVESKDNLCPLFRLRFI